MRETADGRTVAVVAARGVIRSGLCALLREAGHDAVEVGPDGEDGLVTWWKIYGPKVHESHALMGATTVLCVLDNLDALSVIDALRAGRGDTATLVAMVPPDAIELSVQLVEHGAHSVLSTGCARDELLAGLQAAPRGMVSVPRSVARSMASPTTRQLDADELRWLQDLSRGATVAQVARKAGFAERSFYRRLRQVYAVLGCGSRTEAVLEAYRQGLL